LAHAGGGPYGEVFGAVYVKGKVVEQVSNGARDDKPAIRLWRVDGRRHGESGVVGCVSVGFVYFFLVVGG
jgi:hypothetical protein